MVLEHSYVYTHFEMGDSIICNGLIRNLLHKIEYITLFGKKEYKDSMQWMYKDTKNIDILFFSTYKEANEFVICKNPKPILKYGFEYISQTEYLDVAGIQFDEMYYHLANIPFNKRWDDFYVQRNLDKEKSLFSKFDIKEKNYIFVHDSYSNETPSIKLSTSDTIIKPINGLTTNIFDYMYLIENAKEIHCVCSAFKNLVDSMTTIKCPLYFHKNRSAFTESKRWISNCKLPWIHVNYSL